ncbi:MAG TPA: hypothetical protein VGQ65_20415 [Thermoanaerobaculia bacterium]|jgi:predicted SAM-dependent methyltransferase|nr:hypothetical protein [Thermoanaerobaculia bacterium]
MRLHIGSGPLALAGWTNVDIAPWPGVDLVLDVREAWPFTDVELIFAEHFIEHLTLADGHNFFRASRKALSPNGVLRVSTPNLDWVWLTHYKTPTQMSPAEHLTACLEINRAFHGWGHRFLYNLSLLELSLRAAGFADVVPKSYGESGNPVLSGLERHERHTDHSGAPSLVIVEASGVATPSAEFTTRVNEYVRDFTTS